ncbi:hypothetical protein FANTH_10032 [Fusarium anthophilum]|uniref:HpcH/HpaI aldolase/citrate lyase domain-containing protein n=1 Tax=Fusarium anthophilum TaxID=48485 RepID=A0A8H4Z4P8_9HYPO|nr:hypothetical protein FANTH_10032 [Fusarium anthophilum]
MLTKSLGIKSDNITYDLEDSVTPSLKDDSRKHLKTHLDGLKEHPGLASEFAVRINAVSSAFALADLVSLARCPHVDAIVVPKVESAGDLTFVTDVLRRIAPERHSKDSSNPIKIIALIESAKAVMDLSSICKASPYLNALSFAAEDFALDLSITRTPSLTEFLYARSAIVTAALLQLHTLRFRIVRSALARLSDKRLASTKAAEAAKQLTTQFQGKVSTRRQLLDGCQLQKLSLTLNRPELHPGLDVSESAPPGGTIIPYGYHLVYFTPNGVESQIGLDGTDLTFNAPAPFTRRMWAGGCIRWFNERPLRVGEEVEERTKLLSAEPKTSRDGSEMVLVNVEKEYRGEKGVALVDQRTWIFRHAIPQPSTNKVVPTPMSITKSAVQDVTTSPEAWSREIENHPGIVVHGPLNLINMLDYWRDVHGHNNGLSEITYRATGPIYADEQYTITTDTQEQEDGKWRILVKKGERNCMTGDIRAAIVN